MTPFLIGIDDTDNDVSPGTGQLARRLAQEAGRRGIRAMGITRHQFLVDPGIPYTSHNSGACLALESDDPGEDMEFCMELIADWAADGSDPGVCIAVRNAVTPAIIEFGWRATREILTIPQAIGVASDAGLRLRMLGGSGQGIIGALGSVGLRAGGNEGRFLDLPGLRDLGERTTPQELAAMGIGVEHVKSVDGAEPPRGNDVYLTLDWVRPRLVGGKPVWPVQWSKGHDAWIPYDRKKSRPLE